MADNDKIVDEMIDLMCELYILEERIVKLRTLIEPLANKLLHK